MKDQKAPSARDSPMAYLHLDTETRSLVFRLDVGMEVRPAPATPRLAHSFLATAHGLVWFGLH